jgi:hypothetical protein
MVGWSAANERSSADDASGNAIATVDSALSATDKNRLGIFLLFKVDPPSAGMAKSKKMMLTACRVQTARRYSVIHY